jgi:hypothetical protein
MEERSNGREMLADHRGTPLNGWPGGRRQRDVEGPRAFEKAVDPLRTGAERTAPWD